MASEIESFQRPLNASAKWTDLYHGTGEYDEAKIQADCKKEFGITGDADWSVISLAGMDWSSASNIVFSIGEYDPWKIGELPSCGDIPRHCG